MGSNVWRAVKLTTIDFLKNTSLTGFRFIIFLGKSKFLQTLWIPFLLTGVIAGAYITAHCLIYFQLNPTVTYVNSFRYPVAEVPFPGVSICAVNKISKRAVEEYARNISKISKNIDEKVLLNRLSLLGGLYDPIGFEIDETYELQRFFDTVYSSNPSSFNVFEILKKLAPRCEDLLQKCSWEGKTYRCSELFDLRVSPEGFCCMFNYNSIGSKMETVHVRHLDVYGKDMGLKVLLNTSTIDNFYSHRSTIGFIVQIFKSVNYPDILTGEMTEFPVSPKSDVIVPLGVNYLTSEKEIRKFGISQRLCYFADELPHEYGLQYSQPECLLKCKLQNIQSVCNCVPYHTPKDFLEYPVNYCNLGHLDCLSRYKVTWASYRPAMDIGDALQGMEYALTCGACHPLCDVIDYEYQLDKSDFDPENNVFELDDFLFNETNLEHASLLRIFHPSPYCAQYKKQLIYSTNGLLANIGGILGISIGCSMMSSLEIVYYAIIKFYKYMQRLRATRSLDNLDNRG